MGRAVTFDLYRSETEIDGTPVYRPPLQALARQIASGAIGLLAEYPEEAFRALVFAFIVGAWVWSLEWK